MYGVRRLRFVPTWMWIKTQIKRNNHERDKELIISCSGTPTHTKTVRCSTWHISLKFKFSETESKTKVEEVSTKVKQKKKSSWRKAMKYLNGQKESYTLKARKRFTRKKKIVYVLVSIVLWFKSLTNWVVTVYCNQNI